VGETCLNDFGRVVGLLTSPGGEGGAEPMHRGTIISDTTQALNHRHIGQRLDPLAGEQMRVLASGVFRQ
jgi:hypothetical protein